MFLYIEIVPRFEVDRIDKTKGDPPCSDGMSVGFGRNINPKYLKRQYHKMRENARQNRELALSAATGGSFPSNAGGGGGGILHGGVPFVPRTHRLRHESVPNLKPPEFAALLIERLEKVKRDRESQEKVQQSFKKIQEVGSLSTMAVI